MRISVLALLSLAWILPAQALDALVLGGKLIEGGYAEGRVPPNHRVIFDDREIIVGSDGRFLIGFHRDEPEKIELTVIAPDGSFSRRSFRLEQRDYDIQRIDGLPPKQVTPPPEVLERIAADAALVKAARARNSPQTWFDSGWIWPAIGRITGVFGSQRILNGQPRQPHYGIDIAAPAGTQVVAPADGRVSLVHTDMYYSGATLMIDHGRGFASTFLHLQDILAADGQMVRQGEPIATVGNSGRSTGPHLDWRINWFGKRPDASLFVGPMPRE